MATPRKSAAKKAPAKKAAAKKSGNPRTRGESSRVTAKQVTNASAWKGKDRNRPHPLELPSGNVCLVKRMGMESFLKGGAIPNALLGVVESQLKKAKSRGKKGSDKAGMTEKEELDLMKLLSEDPDRLQEMMQMTDLAVCASVIEPVVHMNVWSEDDAVEGLCTAEEVGEFIEWSRRDESVLYIDEVDEGDKQFIFHYISGGSNDLTRFRDEAQQRVAALVAEQGDQDKT